MILVRRLADLPLLVILMGLACAAMLLPAGHALALRQLPTARAFFYSALILFILTAMIAVATANYRPQNQRYSHLVAVIGAYLVVPLLAAVPVQQAMPDLGFGTAWFEMMSSFTTTGATVFESPDAVLSPVHFWRALVGWLGGYFVLVSITAILAPMGLAAVEQMGGGQVGGGNGAQSYMGSLDAKSRLARHATLLFPPYMACTAALWLGLLLAGDPAFVALCHAMATLSTSGISPIAGLQGSASGFAGEGLIFLFLSLAVTARFWQRSVGADKASVSWRDAEVQLAVFLVAVVASTMALRYWIATLDTPFPAGIGEIFRALWGGLFTALSFLTTTGFQSASWPAFSAPGLILLGLAIMGGGIATTAGGVKLLRVYALLRHGERELERIVHPHSIGRHGPAARRLRREGAYLAWIFFMIFGLSLAAIVAALTLTGLGFEAALVLAIASITTTGQLATVMGDASQSYAELGMTPKAILAAAMLLGRLEILAIIAVLTPNSWAR